MWVIEPLNVVKETGLGDLPRWVAVMKDPFDFALGKEALHGGVAVTIARATHAHAEAVRLTLTTVLEEELTTSIGAAPYECNVQRRDYRNGRYRRDLLTTVGLIEDLAAPLGAAELSDAGVWTLSAAPQRVGPGDGRHVRVWRRHRASP